MAKKSFLEKLAGAKNAPLKNEPQKINTNNTSKLPKNRNTPPPKEETAQDYEGQLTIDVYQTANDIIVKSTIAGVKPEDLDVSINNDMLTIKGVRKNDARVKPEDYYYQECYWGPFSRSVILPVDVETDNIKAELANGILTITLPKASKAKTKVIAVEAK